MVIQNVTLRDDSNDQLGRYECHAFAVGESVKKHGFTVTVIRSKFLILGPYNLCIVECYVVHCKFTSVFKYVP